MDHHGVGSIRDDSFIAGRILSPGLAPVPLWAGGFIVPFLGVTGFVTPYATP